MVSTPLSHKEIKIILDTADWIIARGGRTQLAKILKGSKEKKLLEFELDKSPGYGFYQDEKIDEITKKINWMIERDFIQLQQFGKLPLIVFTDRGWLIQSDQYADKLILEWERWIREGKENVDMTYLKDKDRQMILLMLGKIKATGNKDFIPYLELWDKVDYRKVRAAIQETISVLEGNESFDDSMLRKRKERIRRALEGYLDYNVLW